MIDWTKPVQTRDGRPVEIITTKGRGKQPIIAYVGASDASQTWCKDGSYIVHGSDPHHLDLSNVPEPNVYYVRIVDYGEWIWHVKMTSPDATLSATHKITITPGQPPQIEEVK